MKLICYTKCSTCKGVEKILKDKGISYDYRDIKEDNPSAKELKDFHETSGLSISRLFNTSGKAYRDMNLKDKRKEMTDQEVYELLATDGMLVKRPILIVEDKVFIGPDVKKYLETL